MNVIFSYLAKNDISDFIIEVVPVNHCEKPNTAFFQQWFLLLVKLIISRTSCVTIVNEGKRFDKFI